MMSDLFKRFLESSLSKPALFVPTAIMIVFSFFSLTAANDQARILSAVNLGVVNEDAGATSPPIVVSERLLAGFSAQMPVNMIDIQDRATAEAMVERGELSAALVFGENFSAQAISGGPTEFEILSSQHLTVAEVQFVGQLKAVLPAAMSAGVSGIQLALAKGQMPTGTPPVSAKVTDLVAVSVPAALSAPFVMLYTTWLAGFVGAMLLFLATKNSLAGRDRAMISTVLPIATTGVASLMLSAIVALTISTDLFLPVWVAVWLSAIAITWLFNGLISVLGMPSIILWLPVVFYQSAVGGVMIPRQAAPEWLNGWSDWIEFETLGASYRGVVHGVETGYPTVMMASFAAVGLILIWIKALLSDKRTA